MRRGGEQEVSSPSPGPERGGLQKVNRRESMKDAEMPQDNARKLRRWLPEKKLRESISAENFISVLAALAVTVIFIYLGFVAEGDAVEIIARIGITLSGIALGFCLNNFWTEWKRGDSKRVKAIEIDNHVEREIRRTAEDYRETTTSLNTLTTHNDPESYKKSLYFLIKRRLDVQKFVNEKALDIRELGYNYEVFLAEKEESFKEMQRLTDNLVSSISESADSESMKPLIESLKVKPQLAYNHDRIESREPPSSGTMEGEERKENPGPETS